MKLTVLGGSGVKIRLNLPKGILSQSPKNLVFDLQTGVVFYDSNGPRVHVLLFFKKGSKIYILSFKLAVFRVYKVKIRVDVGRGISTQELKILIVTNRVELSKLILMDPVFSRDAVFLKTLKINISSMKLTVSLVNLE